MKKNNLIDYLFNLGKKEYVKKNYSLDSVTEALTFLDNPHKKINNVIHITGTNGKGSVAIYLSKILSSLGYTTGLFISPHLFNITERIQLNNNPISYYLLEKYLFKIYNNIPKKLFYTLTYFELLTCVMFLYFADTQPDFVILEVGLGGKLDATNVVPYSVISCITSISLDHIEVLGNTKIKILKDKAEIIKPDSVFICGVHDKRLQSYLIKRCRKLNTKFIYIPQDNISDIKMDMTKWKTTFLYKIDNKNIPFSLPVCSLIQPYNLVLALKIVEELHKFGFIKKIDYTKIINTVKRTTIPFRMQKFKFDGLTVVVDGAHNVDAVKNFVSTINLLPVNNIVICFTIMKEKDFKNVIKTLSLLDEKIEKFIVYRLETPRCQKLDRLYKEAVKYFNKKVLKFATPNELLNYIKKFCNHNKIFFVGSFYISSLFNK